VRPICPHCKSVLDKVLVEGHLIHACVSPLVFEVKINLDGSCERAIIDPNLTEKEYLVQTQYFLQLGEYEVWADAVTNHVVYFGSNLTCPYCRDELDWEAGEDFTDDGSDLEGGWSDDLAVSAPEDDEVALTSATKLTPVDQVPLDS
jgi:hypothetical protein